MEQETQQQNTGGNMAEDQNQGAQQPKGSAGPLVSSIIIILIVIAGGIYFFTRTQESRQLPPEASEDLVQIQAELNNEDMDAMDAEMDEIEAEIRAEFEALEN